MNFRTLAVLILIFNMGCTAQNDFLSKGLLSSMQKEDDRVGLQQGFPSPTPVPPNAKVFSKSPVFAAQSAIGYTISRTSTGSYVASPSLRDFDSHLSSVRISGTENGYLQNADFYVKAGTKTRPRADANGNWLFSTTQDTNRSLGQVMAFYWLNRQKFQANAILPGSWKTSGTRITVDAYCARAGYNAYWDPSSNLICMGYVGNFQTSYDASIYNHELGHANLQFATDEQIYEGSSDAICRSSSGTAYGCCPTAAGCIGAINEGQADVHAFIVHNSGTLGEFFVNNLSGFATRNAEVNSTTRILTAQARFAGTGKEIHSMGGVWNAAWWTLKRSIGAPAMGKIFFHHLELLQGSDDFRSALESIIDADQQLVRAGVFRTNHRSQIIAAFSQHGISLPPQFAITGETSRNVASFKEATQVSFTQKIINLVKAWLIQIF